MALFFHPSFLFCCNTNFKYWMEYPGVLPESKSWNCYTRVINKTRKADPFLKHVVGKAGKIFSRILCTVCSDLLFYGHVLVSSYYEFLSQWCCLPVNFRAEVVSWLDFHIFNLVNTDLAESLMTMICLEYMFIDGAYYYYKISKLERRGKILFGLHIMLLSLNICISSLKFL